MGWDVVYFLFDLIQYFIVNLYVKAPVDIVDIIETFCH